MNRLKNVTRCANNKYSSLLLVLLYPADTQNNIILLVQKYKLQITSSAQSLWSHKTNYSRVVQNTQSKLFFFFIFIYKKNVID